MAPPRRAFSGRDWQILAAGVFLAFCVQTALQWLSHLPVWQRIVRRFIWWKNGVPVDNPDEQGTPSSGSTAMVLYNDNAESVEWFNMCWRKMWRVYQRGLERWLADLLQPVFDNLVAEVAVPRFVQRLRILEFTLDHEAPYFSRMRRRSSRKDSDLNGVVDVRYTGGARLLLLIEVGQGRCRFKLPVLVSDLDLECKLWIKLRLAPMTPYVGTISLAFVGPPTIKVQLLPYNHVRLMRIPVLQPFLSKLLTVDLPGLMVLPKRLEINIPPAVTAVAEAAVGHDAVMRAVASAVLQADALEHALIAALPLGPQSAAGGVSLPDSFHGELQVTLLEARNLPVWGFPWQSNPYCRLTLGAQAVRSRRDDDTSQAGSHRAPTWNQEFQFLVEDPMSQVLEVQVRDSHMTGRADLGYVKFPLRNIPPGGHISTWLPVQPYTPGLRAEGQLHLKMTYKPFEDDETDTGGYQEAEAYALMLQEQAITDIKSAAGKEKTCTILSTEGLKWNADASSRAAVAASAAAAAVAVTKAAAARAAAKAALNAKARARQKKLEADANAEQTGSGRFERQLSQRGKSISGGNGSRPDRDGGLLSGESKRFDGVEAASQNGSGANGSKADRGDASTDHSRATLDLQNILPEDLFPPVSFSISERDDEDMPYTRPPKPASGPAPKPSSSNQLPPAASAAADDTLRPERRRDTSTGNVQEPPLAFTSVENASIAESKDAVLGARLDLDSDIAEVIEAVAAGDILPLSKDSKVKTMLEKRQPASAATGSSVGRGPLRDQNQPPPQVDASVEVSASEPSTAESERQPMDAVSGRPLVAVSERDSGPTSASRNDSLVQTVLSKLSLSAAEPEKEKAAQEMSLNAEGSGMQHDSSHMVVSTGKKFEGANKAEGESKADVADESKQSWFSKIISWRPFGSGDDHGDWGETPDVEPTSSTDGVLDEKALREVTVANDEQLEAIAEEVQASWRLKEIRVEALLQKAVQASERPWLILLSTLFTATVVLLTLVLWRLYILEFAGSI